MEFYWTELALGAGGVLAFLLFHFGFGSGRPGRERSKAIQGYCLLSWLLMAEVGPRRGAWKRGRLEAA